MDRMVRGRPDIGSVWSRMPTFPSHEWLAAYCEAFADHPDAAEAAERLEGLYRFTVDPAGPLRERHTYHMQVAPDGAGGAHVEPVDSPDAGPRLGIAAGYDRWRQLIEGRLDLQRAYLLRQIRVSGDVFGLIRNLDSTRPLTDSLRTVETDWLDG
jgi:hypothetical protein